MLRFAAVGGPTLLVLPPLFEEANRMRRTLVQVMRALATAHGIGSVLPDLPGTGDSVVPGRVARFADWQAAVAALIATLPPPRLAVSVRAGALFDGTAGIAHRWRLSPETGERVLRDIVRSTALSSRMKPAALAEAARHRVSLLAGHDVHPDLFNALSAATPSDDQARVVGLAREARATDLVIAATLLWRRAEPGEDAALVTAVVTDIASWVARCAAR